MQELSRYHVMIAAAPPRNGEAIPQNASFNEGSDNDDPDFQQKVCNDVCDLLLTNHRYSDQIILGESLILTGGGDWDVQLTMYVKNRSQELFRRFIRRQLRMLPAVLRTNTVAVSLVPLRKKKPEER